MATSEKLNELYDLLMKDTIQIPKSIMAYDDIEDDTKILFSVILNEYNKSNWDKNKFVDELRNITLDRISLECFCSIAKASLIKSELQELIPDIDDILYLNREEKK